MSQPQGERNRRLVVTTALPYANGPLHVGHLLEAVQADLWVRAQRMHGHQVRFVCADDTHGTPIMQSARKAGVQPEDLIAQTQQDHVRDYQGFGISHDHFSSTHSEANRALVHDIYASALEGGLIARGTVRQLYDEAEGIFLADRMVQGGCPRCGAEGQYGDACEACGATYDSAELLNPVSTLSGTVPVERESEHLFFDLPQLQAQAAAWLDGARLQAPVRNKLGEWLEGGLRRWDISREAPYFGFAIPGETDKYFYVWVDAPVGYIASLSELCQERGEKLEDWWGPDSQAEICHFIGKDILYFHGLFWPALLHAHGWRKPGRIHSHGFLSVNGQKMSKSRGTFVLAGDFLQVFPPEALRYYLASRLSDSVADIDFDIAAMVAKYNADVVGKLVNLASRSANFLHKGFDGRMAGAPSEASGWAAASAACGEVEALYDSCDYAQMVRLVMQLLDEANKAFSDAEPWVLARANPQDGQVQQVCTDALEVFRLCAIYLAPVMPQLAGRVHAWLQGGGDGQSGGEKAEGGQGPGAWEPGFGFADAAVPLGDARLPPFAPLASRLKDEGVQQLLDLTARSSASP